MVRLLNKYDVINIIKEIKHRDSFSPLGNLGSTFIMSASRDELEEILEEYHNQKYKRRIYTQAKSIFDAKKNKDRNFIVLWASRSLIHHEDLDIKWENNNLGLKPTEPITEKTKEVISEQLACMGIPMCVTAADDLSIYHRYDDEKCYVFGINKDYKIIFFRMDLNGEIDTNTVNHILSL